MPRIFVMIGLMLSLFLGSCVARPLAPGFAWSYQHNAGEGPKLAYGAPASDDVLLMMTCRPGSPSVLVSVRSGSPRETVILASGVARQPLQTLLGASSGMDQMAESAARRDSPTLVRFARTGALSVVDGSRVIAIDATPMEQASVTRFFQACSA